MHRFYMTPETRQAVIAESNRLIAHRAALSASRRDRTPFRSWEDTRPPALDDDLDGDDVSASQSESAFARLVSELQSLPR